MITVHPLTSPNFGFKVADSSADVSDGALLLRITATSPGLSPIVRLQKLNKA